MRTFIKLIDLIDSTTATNEKIHWISQYFQKVSSADAAWALYFLSGKRFKRFITSQKLGEWCLEDTKIPEWLFLESYGQVGDMAEAVSLLIAPGQIEGREDLSLDAWMKKYILPMKDLNEEEQKQVVVKMWKRHTHFERFVMNKILTGSFRIGVSFQLALKGLSQAFHIPETTLSIRLAGDWEPSEEFFRYLTSKEETSFADPLHPYPFFLASPFEGDLNDLGNPLDWSAEWKWDGIRAQMIFRKSLKAIWSRGKELITNTFPELIISENDTNSFVLDGEILVFENDRPRPFADLQKRLGRKKVTPAIQKSYPAVFMIYDILEWDSQDLRSLPFEERRKKIEQIFSQQNINPNWRVSPLLKFENWQDVAILRKQAESNLTEGLILKKNDSSYAIGRKRGNWWKYKIDNMSVDAILIYAQPGSGYRSGLLTDYTFGVWNGDELVPVVKAYSGLTQEEITELDKWIRQHTLEKFGPVRRVAPENVFEIGFENIQVSKRHKAGLALRFPRIKRWRKDKTADAADNLDMLIELLKKRTSFHGEV